ncbi:unnamed protein product [Closterium sp. Naga37s-1]|nr:unnamed protein product [Closterium sp. Naga37s-1]
MSRRGFPLVAPPAAVLVVLLLVAAAAGGVRGLRGNAAQPRKLAVGGSGDSPRRRAAELVKESPHHASATAGAHVPPLQLIIAEEARGGRSVLGRIGPWGGAWARMHLGSTKHTRSVGEMLDKQSGSMHGMLSGSKTVNPDFYNWNAVYFIYCDGGSFSGHQDQPVRFNVSHLPLRPSTSPPLCLSACSPLGRLTFSSTRHLSALVVLFLPSRLPPPESTSLPPFNAFPCGCLGVLSGGSGTTAALRSSEGHSHSRLSLHARPLPCRCLNVPRYNLIISVCQGATAGAAASDEGHYSTGGVGFGTNGPT